MHRRRLVVAFHLLLDDAQHFKCEFCSLSASRLTFLGSAYCQLIRDTNKAKRLEFAREYLHDVRSGGWRKCISCFFVEWNGTERNGIGCSVPYRNGAKWKLFFDSYCTSSSHPSPLTLPLCRARTWVVTSAARNSKISRKVNINTSPMVTWQPLILYPEGAHFFQL